MQDLGQRFEDAREASVNVVTHKLAMDLGNYALTSQGTDIVASSEFSSDWPAAGAIDGDKTHINAGAPGAAENGIGLSVWQGNEISGGGGVLGTNETLLLSFGQVRKINRLRIFFWPHETKNNNIGDAVGAKDFLIEINPNVSGGSFSAWSGLRDKSPEIGKGDVSISAGQVTGNLEDAVVFEDPTLQSVGQLRITFSKLQSVGIRLRVVEIEVTRAIDLTKDVSTATIARRKDYRLNHRLAGELNLNLTNHDRKYSPNYTPTAAEAAANYFNSELRPNLEVRYFAGFDGVNAQMFTGFVDRFEPKGESRTVGIKCRDAYKLVIGKQITTNLKSQKSLEFLGELVANICGIPSNMMILDSTSITAALFFPKDEEALALIQKLADATGDGEAYFDEMGVFSFRSYFNVVSNIFFLSQQGDWEAGTLVNIDTTTEPGSMILTGGPSAYVAEGTFESAESGVLTGFVEWGTFEASYLTGEATSVDFFVSASPDGINFEPYRQVFPGVDMKGWINDSQKIKIKARLRSSDPTQTPKVMDITVNYRSRGGSRKYAATFVAEFSENGTLMALSQVLTDEVGGANYMITKSIVKSNPFFRAAGAVTAWQALSNGNIVSVSNPLILPVGDTTFEIDFGDTKYDVPQTPVITLGTAVATASITSHPTKPVLTVSVTTAGTIEELYVTGFPFVNFGVVEAIKTSEKRILDIYGERPETFESEYIDNKRRAQDIANMINSRFGQPLLWCPTAGFRLSPNLQINDRVRIIESNTGLDSDFGIISVVQSLTVTGVQLNVDTQAELVKIGAEGESCDPAKFDQFKFDQFRFGGCADLGSLAR